MKINSHQKLTIQLHPGASQNKIEPIGSDSFKIYITARPIKGAANKKMLELLSKHLKIAKTNLKIVRGHTSKTKIVEILI